MHQATLELAPPPDEAADRTGFDIGWDHARHGLVPPAEGLLAQILDRRSHRRWTEDPVPEELLQTLLATAFCASAKSDLMQSGVILIRDKAKQQQLALEHVEAAGAGRVAVELALLDRFQRGPAFQHFEAVGRDQQRARGRVEAVAGAADALDHPAGALRCADLDH